MEEKIIELSNQVKAMNHCNGCGGSCKNGICMYCGNENQKLIYLSLQLEKEISKLGDNYFERGMLHNCLTSLYMIRDMEISSVTKILDDYNYINTINDSYVKIFGKIKEVSQNQVQLTDSEYYLLLNSYLNDKFSGQFQLAMFGLFTKKILEGNNENNISNLDKEKIFLKGTELMATQILGFKKAHVRILEDTPNKKENTLGQAFFNNIDLSRKVIHDNPVQLLPTIFHELIHLKQYKEQRIDCILSDKNMIEIKDAILMELLKGYYKDNYDSISFEKEAFFYMHLETMDYLNGIGLETSLDIKEKALFYEQTCGDYITNKNRVYLGEIVNLEELFRNEVISHPEILTVYPQLSFEYKLVDDKVLPKTLEDIQEDYECYQNGTLTWNGNKDEINYLYQKKMEEFNKGINI